MNELSLTNLLAIVAITLTPGIALVWRFVDGPTAPYRRRIERLVAAENAHRVLSSLGQECEGRREVRQAEIGILGRAEFDREVRRSPRPLYLALGAWTFLTIGFAVEWVPGPAPGWVGLILLCTGIMIGAMAGLGIRGLLVAARPKTLLAYRELCLLRRGQTEG